MVVDDRSNASDENDEQTIESDSESDQSEISSGDDEYAVTVAEDPPGAEEPIKQCVNRARVALSRNEFDASFSWYCVAFDCDFHVTFDLYKEEIEEEFSTVVSCCSKLLQGEGRDSDALECIRKGLSLFPSNLMLNLQCGKILLSQGEKDSAAVYLWNCCKSSGSDSNHCGEMDEDNVIIKKEAVVLLRNNFIDQWFFRMLNDKRRNLNYKLAIQQVFKEKLVQNRTAVVLDLGSGTGLLTAYCAQAGFNNIVASDKSPMMCSVAEEVLRCYRSSQQTNISVVCSMAETLQLKSHLVPHSKIDVIVTEIFDCAFFGEHVLPIMHKIWTNLLSQSERVNCNEIILIPQKAIVYAVAVQSAILKRNLIFDQNVSRGLKLPYVCVGRRESATYENFMLSSNPEIFSLLSKPETLYEIEFQNFKDYNYLKSFEIAKTPSFGFDREGSFDAIVVYFDVYLSDTFKITTDPVDKQCCKCWGQAVFPSGLSSKFVQSKSQENFIFSVHNLTDLSIRTVGFEPSIENIFWTDDSHFISCLNNSKCFESALRKIYFESSLQKLWNNGTAFIVLSEPSLLPFYLLSELKFSNVYIELVTESGEMSDMFISFCRRIIVENDLPENAIQFIESFDQISPEELSLVYCDLIYLSGKLNMAALQKLTELKSRVAKAKILPKILNVYCHFIDSEELTSNNEILSDSNLCGVEMKKVLEIFRSNSIQSVDLNFLEYMKIGERVQIGCLDLANLENFEFEFETDATDEFLKSNYPVLLFSYGVKLTMTSLVEVTTQDLSNDFKLCGLSLLKESKAITVKSGLKTKIKIILKNGLFKIIV